MIATLTNLIKPPRHPVGCPAPDDWIELETSIGFVYPPDVKEILQVYGIGLFDEHLFVLPPKGGPSYYGILSFLDRGPDLIDLLPISARDHVVLAPCAFTRNGEEVYLRNAPVDESVVAVGQDDDITIERGPFCDFLMRLLTSQIRPKGFTTLRQPRQHIFTP